MGKFRVEYTSKITGEVEVAPMRVREDMFSLIDTNIDWDKEIKIFEKLNDWHLAYHRINGKTVLRDFSDEKENKRKAELAREERGKQIQNGIDKAISFFDKDICPSRKENQAHMDLIFDHFFGGEDISKPKLEVVKKNIEDLKVFK